jgi:transcriptional regulator with XRE-family HTH domain
MKDGQQHTDFYRQLGANIRKCREGRKLSQEALARLIGLTRTSLTNIESGRQHPPLHTFCDIAEQLEVKYSELIPRARTAAVAVDLEAMAGLQVRGEDELAFIASGIRMKERNPHGVTEEKNSRTRGRASNRK